MTVRTLLVSLVAASLCTACSSNKDASAGGGEQRKTLAGTADSTKQRAARPGTGEVRLPQAPVVSPTGADDTGGFGGIGDVAIAPGPADAAAAAPVDIPPAPADAQWTIFCARLGGGDHVALSRKLKTKLIERSGMREWYIVHESDGSSIYYGYYRSINDPQDAAETQRARADRKKIDEFVDGGGERPFRECQFVQLSPSDSDAPPAWNLANAPADKVWSLMIGAYKDTPDRKRLAVEAVREARDKFGVEAYYHHGETVSNVFVGAWPDAAVVEERIDAGGGANKFHDDVMVLPPGWKDPGAVRNRQGRPVRAVSQRLVPVDPDLLAKIQQYPEMGVNGDQLIYKDPKTGRQRVQGSEVVAIPRASNNLFGENAESWRDAQAAGRAGVGGTQNGIGLRPGMDLRARSADPYGGAPRIEEDGSGWQGPGASSPSDPQQPARTRRRTSGSGLRSIEDE